MALTKVPSNLDATVSTTQSASDNSTKVATTAYVTTAISALSDSAPAALNTLNEIAAALGDDANYASTTTAAIAAKLPLAGGTLTGNITASQSVFNITNNDIRFKTSGAETMLRAVANGAVEIMYDNDTVFQTIASGAQIGRNNDGTVRLQLYGTTAADHEIFFGNDGTNGHKDGAIRYFGEANGVTANRRAMTFSTGGNVERMRITSNGYVGIGVTPTHHFNLQGTGAVEARFRSTDGDMSLQISSDADETHNSELNFMSGTSGRGSITYDHHTTAATQKMLFKTGDLGVTAMTILGDGKVGIGTASPYGRLELNGSGNEWDTAPALRMWDSTNNKGWFVGTANNTTAGDFYIRSLPSISANPGSSQQQFTIKHTGNVGIGTTAPGSQLHIKGTGHQRIKVEKTDAGGDADISIANRSDGTGWVLFTDAQAGANSGVIKYVHNGDYMSFRTNGVDDRMRIGSDGAITHSMTAQNTTSINTTNSDGPITLFKNNGTTRGMIGNAEGTMNGGTGNFGIRATADLIFSTGGGNKRWKVSSSGHFTPNNQHSYDIGGTNAEVRNIYAQGISFASNAHAAGKTSELLDDYEEGTWTPVLQNTAGQQPTHGTQSGKYTKVGDMVHVHGTITTTAGANMSGTIIISGLPFASNSGGNLRNVGSMGALGGCGAGAENCRLVLDPNNSYIFIIKQNGNAYSHNPGFGAAINMYGFSIVYSAA